MDAAVRVLLLLLLLAPASCAAPEGTGSEIQTTPATERQAVPIGDGDLVQYIVVFKERGVDVAAATARLSRHLRRRAGAAAAAAAADATIASGINGSSSSSSAFTVASSLAADPWAADVQDGEASSLAAAAAEAPEAPRRRGRGRGLQGIVVHASPQVAEAIRASGLASAVFEDLLITNAADAAAPCATARALSAGTIAPRAVGQGLSWPTCVSNATRLVWVGQRCGGTFNRIAYKAVFSLWRANDTLRKAGDGQPCVLLPDPGKAAWTRGVFGSGCGVAPSLAKGLPTSLCAPTSPASADPDCAAVTPAPSTLPDGSSGAGLVQAQLTLRDGAAECGGAPARSLMYVGAPCGPGKQLVRWTVAFAPDGCVLRPRPDDTKYTADVFGTGCGVPPGAVDQPASGALCAGPAAPPSPSPQPMDGGTSPSPDKPSSSPSPSPIPSPSPAPPPWSRLQRVPLAGGDLVPAGVQRIEAGSAATGVASTAALPVEQQVVVGIMDSGIDATHPDLMYFGGVSFITNSTADVDRFGHGTHVAGIVGARNNGQGVVGVSPSVPLLSIKVIDDRGAVNTSSLIAAIKWATDQGLQLGLRVLNLSFSWTLDPAGSSFADNYATLCEVLQEASDAGIFVAVAAGNDGGSTRGVLPASCPAVAAVTGVDVSGTAPYWRSNFLPDNEATDQERRRYLAAPGESVYSTASSARFAVGYMNLSGTSMASPHVAGVAANCRMSGACAPGSTGVQQLAVLREAARQRLKQPGAAYGFRGDARSTINAKYYGTLVWGGAF